MGILPIFVREVPYVISIAYPEFCNTNGQQFRFSVIKLKKTKLNREHGYVWEKGCLGRRISGRYRVVNTRVTKSGIRYNLIDEQIQNTFNVLTGLPLKGLLFLKKICFTDGMISNGIITIS